jgi:hypothetical protein
MGILELSTGRLTAANAGHEFPAFRQPGGVFELYKDKHGFVIGGMEDVKYREYEIQMEPGSKLFVYTDGVVEATSAGKELFGTERMIDALNVDPDASPQEILRNVRASVDGFVKEAEQFDDLTMLCVEYRGGTNQAGGQAGGQAGKQAGEKAGKRITESRLTRMPVFQESGTDLQEGCNPERDQYINIV